MNREQVEKRKAELLQGLEELKANIVATNGAIQDCDYWLAQLDAEEKKIAATKEKKV
jgi:hypothetical protein